MLTGLETGAETLPCVVKASGAYAAGETTAREYNAALRVAALEDAMKKPFYEVTWADVKVGDTVLMPWPLLDRIVKVEIKHLVTEPGLDGKPLVIARYVAFGDLEFGQSFDPEETVYVQSRL